MLLPILTGRRVVTHERASFLHRGRETYVLFVCVLVTCGSVCVPFGNVVASGVQIVWEQKPQRFLRGQRVTFAGQVQHRGRALRRAVYISLSLSRKGQSKQDFPLSTSMTRTDGAFLIRSLIPHSLPSDATKLELRVVLWRLASTRQRAVGKGKSSQRSVGSLGLQAPTLHDGGKKGRAERAQTPGAQGTRTKSGSTRDNRAGYRLGQRGTSGHFGLSDAQAKAIAARKKRLKALQRQLQQGWGPALKAKKRTAEPIASTHDKMPSFLMPQLPGAKRTGRRQGTLPGQPGRARPVQRSTLPQFPGGRVGSGKPGKGPNSLSKPGLTPGGGGGLSRPGAKPSGRKGRLRGTQDIAKRGIRTRGPGSPGRMPSGAGTGFPGASRPKPPASQTPLSVPNTPGVRYNNGPIGAQGPSRVLSNSQQSALDLQTGGGQIYLRQVFDPYMPAFQRITILDRVNLGYTLGLSSAEKRPIPVGGKRKSSRSYFTGRLQVALIAGRWTPIPSVAPDARILWARTTPPVRLAFAKNAGDTVFVKPTGDFRGTVSLEFGTDGDLFYFDKRLPRKVKAYHYPARLRPDIPWPVRAHVLRHLSEFGLYREMTLDQLLLRLVPFYRSFAARPLRWNERQGDRYLTLMRAKVGVCRHRAMLFTVTMQSLGFPARFVGNGAHAFSEVQFPDGRWKRINLGGGDVPNWMGKWRGRRFDPKDPFPPSTKSVPRSSMRNPPPDGGSRHARPNPGQDRPSPSVSARNTKSGSPSGRSRLREGRWVMKKIKKKKKKQPSLYLRHSRLRLLPPAAR